MNKTLTIWLVLAACVAVFALTSAVAAQGSSKYPGIGRVATPAEVSAWDIDVRADFKGLPTGSGTTKRGEEIWEAQCASCHGTFGESNEIHTPIVGGTSKDDIKTGRVANLQGNKQPQRTTLMKAATLSTLWDYIYRAMPWHSPRSLTSDDTYAVLAYILALGDVLPAEFTLSDKNIRDVQRLMPNRNGMTQNHGLWRVDGRPDVQGRACMTNCASHVTIGSSLPDHARNAQGNLAEQNRTYGPYRGIDTSKPVVRK